MSILSSASKLVFMTLTVTVCATFAYEVITNRITLDPKDFMALALMAFTYYFSSKGSAENNYLGK